MSMWLSFVRVSASGFKKIKANPELLDSVFFGEGKRDKKVIEDLGIDQDKHVAGLDYLVLSAAFEAMGDEGESEETDEDDSEGDADDAVIADLAPTGTVPFDVGYDEAFFLAPAAVKRALAESSVPEADKDVKALFKAALREGQYVIGIVS